MMQFDPSLNQLYLTFWQVAFPYSEKHADGGHDKCSVNYMAAV